MVWYVCYHINLRIIELKFWETERRQKTIYLFEFFMQFVCWIPLIHKNVFFNKYTASYGVICVTLIKITFKNWWLWQTSLISISCDLPLLPSKDLIFFVCVASARVKQIDSAINWILSILQKQKQHVSVMGSNTWLNMGLLPFHIYAYNGVWLWYMSLPAKWQEQSYCSCFCIRASQMITLLWFCKSYVPTMYL